MDKEAHYTTLQSCNLKLKNVLSKLIHLWILLPNPPDEDINSLQKLCYQFIWSNKQDKINRKTVHKSVQKGGTIMSSTSKTCFCNEANMDSKVQEW